MIYSNPEFIALFLVTFAAFTLAGKYQIRFCLLLVASLVFYAWASLFDSLIFLSVVFLSWISVALAARYRVHSKLFIGAGIVLMAAHLAFWKYAPWICSQIQVIAPDFLAGRKLSLPLPIGISFFTLQGIAYLVDFQRGQVVFMGIREFLLFKSFFAQLVAGPIVRANELLPQLRTLTPAKHEDLSAGLSLFVLGFFKKVMLADSIAPYVDSAFDQVHLLDRTTLLTALIGYSFQIWADFSGYTDMGRGGARMLGIKLPENFLSPYLSKSPSEFWKRWHISLSQWIRDYIYIPLGGSKGGHLRAVSVAVATMAISGLWHGANWTFLVWGLFHGALLVSERLIKESFLSAWFRRHVPHRAQNVLLVATMFTATLFGWLIFRSESLSAVALFMSGVARNQGTSLQTIPAGHVHAAVCAGIAIQLLSYSNFSHNRLTVFEWLLRYGRRLAIPAAGWAAGAALALVFVVSLVLRNTEASKAFIYFQF